MRLAETAGRAFDRILDICAWIGCGMLAFQVVSVSFEIVCRYFFNTSFSIITPLNEWSLVYLTMLGAAWLQREGGHTSDDSIVTLLPPWVRRLTRRIGWVLAIVTCVLLTWYGALATWDNYSKQAYDFFKLPNFPIYLVYIVIPIGSLLWLIQLLRKQSRPSSADEGEDTGGDI
jgi:TRAP-type C4-dicarboxylate transport system permease small subunit